MHFSGRSTLLIAALALAVCCVLAQESENEAKQVMSARNILPKLFDFGYYKKAFNKKYKSLIEELAHKTYFVARSFKIFVSAVAYKYRRSSHYLAINFMSDMTPGEREAMKNRAMAERAGREANRLARGGRPMQPATELKPTPEEQAKSIESLERQIEGDIEQVIAGKTGVEFADLLGSRGGGGGGGGKSETAVPKSKSSRKKRSADEKAKKPRNLSFESLVKLPDDTSEPPEVRAHIKSGRVASNNPNYIQIEVPTQGLVDQQEPVKVWNLPESETSALMSDFTNTKSYFLASSKTIQGNNDADDGELYQQEDENEDKMFFDHRESGCLFTPRAQGKCGSCYAFSTIAYIEWLHCMRTGNLVAFSEQYMIDCGNKRIDGDALEGCHGGTLDAVPKFLHNFGVELRANYPYRMQAEQCPYDEETDLDTVGYIRMHLDNVVDVPRSRWEEIIRYTPLVIGVATSPEFDDYGGGVDSGDDCPRDADHAMLLVGHGREDGEEYWLIRNSYSPGWGDMGYYKLSKDAPRRCTQESLAYGTRDGKIFTFDPYENARNDHSAVKNHYSQAIHKQIQYV